MSRHRRIFLLRRAKVRDGFFFPSLPLSSPRPVASRRAFAPRAFLSREYFQFLPFRIRIRSFLRGRGCLRRRRPSVERGLYQSGRGARPAGYRWPSLAVPISILALRSRISRCQALSRSSSNFTRNIRDSTRHRKSLLFIHFLFYLIRVNFLLSFLSRYLFFASP